MPAKKMEYVGTNDLLVTLPNKGVVLMLKKGDVVDYDEFGGDQFNWTDFKPKTAAKKPAPKKGS